METEPSSADAQLALANRFAMSRGALSRTGADGSSALLRGLAVCDCHAPYRRPDSRHDYGHSICFRLVNALAFPINSVETARLLLRVPELADAEALMGIFWDPEVVEQKQVTLLEPPGGLDLALKNTNDMLRQWELRGYGHWSVIEKVTGHVIGCVGFYHRQGQWPGVTKIGERFERADVDPVHGEPVHVYTIART